MELFPNEDLMNHIKYRFAFDGFADFICNTGELLKDGKRSPDEAMADINAAYSLYRETIKGTDFSRNNYNEYLYQQQEEVFDENHYAE